MPSNCAAFGCSNRSNRETDLTYHRFPPLGKRMDDSDKELCLRRRKEWLRQIHRADITVIKDHHRVCSDHFVSGKPSLLHQTFDLDWIPTLKLGHPFAKKTDFRGARLSARNQQKEEILEVASNKLLQAEAEAEAAKVSENCSEQAIQTDMSMAYIKRIENEINNLASDLSATKEKLKDTKFTMESFKDKDYKVKYYTGLDTFDALCELFEYLEPFFICNPNRALSSFEMYILTLMRCRLDTPMQHLAYIFDISRHTVSRIFNETIHIMYQRMKPLIIWPEREVLRATQPTEFSMAFNGRVAVIIDCFELFIERPSNLVARAQTWSTYKHNNTVKYLIGIAPHGAITFLSEGWGGRTSDKHITDNTSFLNNLLPGDIVLADRGFNIAESVGLRSAEVKIPAFTKGKTQLSAFEVESTRRIAHLRIHIERVIGCLCMKYSIFNSTLSLDLLRKKGDDLCTTLDKIVTVCAALVNMNQSVVANK